jgi:hypothetical protein
VKKLAFSAQNKAILCKNWIITLVFEKNAIFCRKLAKIAENCDHYIDPRSIEQGPILKAQPFCETCTMCVQEDEVVNI